MQDDALRHREGLKGLRLSRLVIEHNDFLFVVYYHPIYGEFFLIP